MEKRSPHISRFAVLSLSHTKSRTERNGFARFQPRILLLRCEESTSFREWKSSRYLLLFLFFFRSISAGDFYHEASSWDRARVLRCNYRCDIIVELRSDSRLKTLYWSLCNLQPKPGSDGTYPRDKAKAVSGEKLLRSIMQDSKIELYATYVSLTLLSLLLMQVFEMSLLFRGKWWTVEVEEAVELALLRQVNFIYLFFCFWIIWFDLWL